MAVHAYTGINGSGKSYEAVESAILPALRKGRRVVSNVDGLSFERIRDYLGKLDDGSVLTPDKLVYVPTERIEEPAFFYDPDAELPEGELSIVQPGDLVVVDECWRFWGEDCTLSEEHKLFFRMHRHYAEEGGGWTCDMVIMTQDLSGLNRFVKNILESNYLFTKMKSFGLSSRYQVQVFQGKSRRMASRLAYYTKKYNKKIFPLYKSYDTAGAVEGTVDDRIVFWKDWKFLGAAAFGFGLLAICGTLFFRMWSDWRSGGGHLDGKDQVAAEIAPVPHEPRRVAASSPSGIFGGGEQGAYLVGVMERPGGVIAWIRDGDRIREIEVSGGVIDGRRTRVIHEGQTYVF